jgi:tRNA pseudouridine32 synthase/23S rRNA pseudouridine746 synthase
MAEFWWGESPKSEIRKHKHYYPACKSKCEPILGHMLQGMEMDENPLLKNLSATKSIDILYEDEAIIIINKPAELLSIPGIHIEDSVQTRLQKRFPQLNEIQVVHRLDMSTSGLMLVAKNEKVYKFLQYQFIHRHIKKRYVAVLDGIISENEGKIELPLRVDLDDRPRQLVDLEHGKSAITHWKVIKRENGKTHIHFYPVTGRTHQLRVHAAHPMGLNIPIVGDDLYGRLANRLHLHAEWIEFLHPTTKKKMNFRVGIDFLKHIEQVIF